MLESLQSNCQRVSFAQHHHLLVCHIPYTELTLNYVLKLSLDEMSSSNTPRVSKLTYKDKIEDLRRKADFRNIIKPTELKSRAAVPQEIKELKQIGNRILSSIASEYRAWHVDFSDLFERYVQHVFSLLAKQIGARILCSNKFAISGSRREWGLAYSDNEAP